MSSETEEEIVDNDEDEGDDEESSGGDSWSSSSVPPSPPGPQTRPLSSASSDSSLPTDPFRKKTRDLPNIYNCHSCGLRFPDKGRWEWLQPLDSQWRIVLLCRTCLRAIRTAEVCSYCFAGFGEEKEGGIGCRRCSARVHLGCVPKQRWYLAATDLDPDLFLCVDCCALPRSPFKTLGNVTDSCAARAASVSMEDVVRRAKCAAAKKLELAARAKEKAVAKAVAAKRAAELARSALYLVVVAEKKPLACTQEIVADEKLALQLHLSMNGSQRISRNSCPDNSDLTIDCKRGRFSINSVSKGSESGGSNTYDKVELCTDDTLSDTMEENHHVQIGTREGIDQNKEVRKNGRCNPEEIAQWEKQGSCSDMLANSTRDENSVDSVSSPCPRSIWLNTFTSTVQEEEKCSMPDRYLKKYCKRPASMKDKKENGGSGPLLVPVGQCANPG